MWQQSQIYPAQRELHCPVLWAGADGVLLVMPAASPITDLEAFDRFRNEEEEAWWIGLLGDGTPWEGKYHN